MNVTIQFAWIYSLIAAAVVLVAGKGLLHLGLLQLRRLAARTEGNWDNQLIEAVSKPMHWLLVIGAIAAAAQFAPEVVTIKPLHWSILRIVMVLWFFWILWRVVSTLIMSDLFPTWTDEARHLLMLIARTVMVILTVLSIADAAGLSITPVLASLGVGSLAVALALQDTLSNFFAGVYLLIDKPVRVGDFVKVDDATEGHIVRIGWRSTWLKQVSNNIVVIPNGKLLGAQITNYNLQQSECLISIPVGVSYDSNLDFVEKTLIALATQVLHAQGLDFTTDPPLVRFLRFGDSSIDLNLIVRLREVTQTGLIRHLLVKRIHEVFREARIEIPYPHRTMLFPQQAQQLAAATPQQSQAPSPGAP